MISLECPVIPHSPTLYRKASGKPLALAMGMNTVVALATLKKLNIFVLYSRSE